MTTLVINGEFRTPTGYKVKGQSYASIEKLADSVRPHLPRMGGSQFKLDCLSIFESTLPKLGYNYRTSEIEDLDDCAAFTMTTENGNVVVLRTDIYDKLHAENPFGRSTVVHELSHIALAHSVSFNRGSIAGQHAFYEDTEWQAKACTAALMMPLEACKVAKSPTDLARMCGTSEESARYRIKNLVGKQKLLTPSHQLWTYGQQ